MIAFVTDEPRARKIGAEGAASRSASLLRASGVAAGGSDIPGGRQYYLPFIRIPRYPSLFGKE